MTAPIQPSKFVSRDSYNTMLLVSERHRRAFIFVRNLLPWGFLIGLGLGVCIGAWL